MNILTAEYRNPTHKNPNIKGAGRLMTIAREGDNVRIRIVGAPFIATDPMVVESDAVIPAAGWEQHKDLVLDSLTAMNAKVTR